MFQETTMNAALALKLARLGWNPTKVVWGRWVSADMHGVTLERGGVERYYAGPYTQVTVRGCDQMAIVHRDK